MIIRWDTEQAVGRGRIAISANLEKRQLKSAGYYRHLATDHRHQLSIEVAQEILLLLLLL
jgi:hypothetical protein